MKAKDKVMTKEEAKRVLKEAFFVCPNMSDEEIEMRRIAYNEVLKTIEEDW